MLCNDFEERLTDYLDGALEPEVHKTFAEHALRCPVCHDTLSEVKSTMRACSAASVLEAPRELEARILLSTMPKTAMTCEDFEEFLTDYLDGFLPAPLYHRWERHAVLCARCTELPGEVVRAIGTCYIYVGEEKPLPAGLHERILLATSGSQISQEIRAPFGERFAAWLRLWLDPIVYQLAGRHDVAGRRVCIDQHCLGGRLDRRSLQCQPAFGCTELRGRLERWD